MLTCQACPKQRLYSDVPTSPHARRALGGGGGAALSQPLPARQVRQLLSTQKNRDRRYARCAHTRLVVRAERALLVALLPAASTASHFVCTYAR